MEREPSSLSIEGTAVSRVVVEAVPVFEPPTTWELDAPRRDLSVEPPLNAIFQGFGAAWSWILAPAFCLGCTTTLLRLRAHPALYQSAMDKLEHASAAFVCYASMSALLWWGGYAIRMVSRVAGTARWLRIVWQGVVCLVAAFFFRRAVLAKIDVLAVMGRWAYGLAIPLGGVTVVGIPRWMDRPLPWRGWLSGTTLILASVLGQLAIQRTIWPSQAAPPVLLVAMVALAGFGGALCVNGVTGVVGFRRVRTAMIVLLASAIGLLGLRAPGARLRKAVLVYGGIERLAIRGILWPLATDLRLGPGVFWRADPTPSSSPRVVGDARDLSIDGRAVHFGRPGAQAAATAPAAPHRNGVWILIDTLRADSLTAAVASDPVLSDRYGAFTWYRRFRSCSTMTKMVLAQTLGSAGGGPGLLDDLRRAGYQTARFGAYPPYSPPEFVLNGPEEGAADAVARVSGWMAATPKPAFAFIHLRGGHDPLRTSGASDRQRYDRAIAASALAASEIFPALPPDWLIVVSGDHGEGFGEHGMSNHANSVYDELLQTPVLIRGHGAAPGWNDESLGCPELVGKIRRALGGMPYERDDAPFQFAILDNYESFPRDRQAALTIGRYKAIWNLGANTRELYDLSRDAGERIDLAETEVDVSGSFTRAFALLNASGRIN